jgi:hypothetical protein
MHLRFDLALCLGRSLVGTAPPNSFTLGIGQSTALKREKREKTMKRYLLVLVLAMVVPFVVQGQTKDLVKTKGILLEDLTWIEAEKVLTPDTMITIPLGAEAKEHGPHLKLKNDWLMAEYLKTRVLEQADVVMAPTINYNFYPAFLEYPGSTSLRLETARDVMINVCRSLAHHGPRRFYIINTGVSTLGCSRIRRGEVSQ